MTRVAVLGAGAWGTALADLLARKGIETRLWAYEAEVATSINDRHANDVFFHGMALDLRLRATTDLAEAVRGVDTICSVTPSHVARDVWSELSPHVGAGTRLICATKGIEPDTLEMMCDVADETLPQATFVALSGPSFADEVYQGQPTAVVAASEDALAAEATQQLLSTPYFRVYTGSDVIGVELGGSLKNTIAIAAGMLEGMGLGHNPLAALLTRGLSEIARLGLALGARQETFAGLAGMGDLILTCTGGLSRNRQLGVLLARGTSLEEYRATHRSVAEGVNTALAGSRLAERVGVEMPITRQVAEVLFDGVPAKEALTNLMERRPKAEQAR